MIKWEDLKAAKLPAEIIYTGKKMVPKKLHRLTVTGFGDLNIGFLSDAGSTSVQTAKGCLWALDVLINYDLVDPAST